MQIESLQELLNILFQNIPDVNEVTQENFPEQLSNLNLTLRQRLEKLFERKERLEHVHTCLSSFEEEFDLSPPENNPGLVPRFAMVVNDLLGDFNTLVSTINQNSIVQHIKIMNGQILSRLSVHQQHMSCHMLGSICCLCYQVALNLKARSHMMEQATVASLSQENWLKFNEELKRWGEANASNECHNEAVGVRQEADFTEYLKENMAKAFTYAPRWQIENKDESKNKDLSENAHEAGNCDDENDEKKSKKQSTDNQKRSHARINFTCMSTHGKMIVNTLREAQKCLENEDASSTWSFDEIEKKVKEEIVEDPVGLQVVVDKMLQFCQISGISLEIHAGPGNEILLHNAMHCLWMCNVIRSVRVFFNLYCISFNNNFVLNVTSNKLEDKSKDLFEGCKKIASLETFLSMDINKCDDILKEFEPRE